ncbi:hypothetical protein QUA35_06315 [Microcoleus sp. N9_B2]|uniref:hypothetical protein n=1 Tax=unclassified Microcoleus TaxID=2642155 RepID=UPI002FD3C7BF
MQLIQNPQARINKRDLTGSHSSGGSIVACLMRPCDRRAIARGHLNNRQKLIIATKIQNPKPKTPEAQYDRSS